MADEHRIFVILDPTTMEQISLVRGEIIAREMQERRSRRPLLHIYCCVDEDTISVASGEDADGARAAMEQRIHNWIERLADHTRSLGLEAETEVEIKADWRSAIIDAVGRQKSELVIKGMTEHSRLVRMFRETSDWQLLRDANGPVLLVKYGQTERPEKLLVAVKHSADHAYSAANDRLLAVGRTLAGNIGAELHVVTAYSDKFSYPDRQKFADRCELPRNRVRASMGKPEEAIAEASREIGADLVIIARVGRPDGSREVGHTAEKVIDDLDSDILVLPMTEAA